MTINLIPETAVRFLIHDTLIAIALLLAATTAFGQVPEATSASNKALKLMLRRYPRSDADKNGELTRTELNRFREKYVGIKPTHRNIHYGEHEKQTFDLWLAESKTGKPTPLVLFIHGGGFRGGDKDKAKNEPVGIYLEAGVSYASLNYRLTDVGPYPMQHRDCARAMQSIRHRAKEWNIDPNRIACSGGSAGAGISLWLAFHDDLADPTSKDPAARQSTRLTAVATSNGQSTYDLHEFRKIFRLPTLKMHEALYAFYDVENEADWDSDQVKQRMVDASAITHFDKSDRVPVMLKYDSSGPARVTMQTNPSAWVHHIKLGRHLKEKMDQHNVECQVYGGVQKVPGDYIDQHDFLIQKLSEAVATGKKVSQTSQPRMPVAEVEEASDKRRKLNLLASSATRLMPTYKQDIQPLLARYCFDCHGKDKAEAKLRLDAMSPEFANTRVAEQWQEVLHRLEQGEMPPEESAQPNADQLQTMTQWLREELTSAATAKRQSGRIALRRLNRREYGNTMRDLLRVDLDYTRDLPPDPVSKDGFRNDGSVLSMSTFQMECYVQAARMGLGKAIVTGEAPPVIRVTARNSQKGEKDPKRVKQADGNVVPAGANFFVRLNEFPKEGEVVVRVHAKADSPPDAAYPRLLVTLGVRGFQETPHAGAVLGEVNVQPGGEVQTFEFRRRIETCPQPGHNPKYPGMLITLLHQDEHAAGNTAAGKRKSKSASSATVTIESVEFAGPVSESWPPAHHRRILFPRKESEPESHYVRGVIRKFMERAYRRPATDPEVSVMEQFFRQARETRSLEQAIRETLTVVLISPEFLYLNELKTKPAAAERITAVVSKPVAEVAETFDKRRKPKRLARSATTAEQISDYELASRLSYFLWSTMPDDELFQLAKSGTLRDDAVLKKQVRRMIQDEKSQQFVTQFTNQWLALSGLESLAVNPDFYPGFDSTLRVDMRGETEAFFAEVLRNNLSCLEFIDSDFCMLNHRLARHYGIAGPKGIAFERVALKPEDHRGGLLTHASVLLRNSSGEESHPVRRAVWLMDRLLDDPPPPPPPDVPEFNSSQKSLDGLSFVRQLEIHREKQACNNCHRRVDPWGMPFENYDSIGRYRTRYINPKGAKKLPPSESRVRPVSTMPTGEKIQGMNELKQYLLNHQKEPFIRSLTRRLLSYALRRSLDAADAQAVQQLLKQSARNEHRLSDLLVAIVQSEAFQTK